MKFFVCHSEGIFLLVKIESTRRKILPGVTTEFIKLTKLLVVKV